MGRTVVQFISECNLLSGQHHAPGALYPQYLLDRRLGGPQSCSGQRLEENSIPSTRDRNPIQAVNRHCTD
jgi:hypothetical protein